MSRDWEGGINEEPNPNYPCMPGFQCQRDSGSNDCFTKCHISDASHAVLSRPSALVGITAGICTVLLAWPPLLKYTKIFISQSGIPTPELDCSLLDPIDCK